MTAAKNQRTWDADELALVQPYLTAPMTTEAAREIAALLGRTPGAVQRRVANLRAAAKLSRPPNRRAVPPALAEEVRRSLESGLGTRHIAKATGLPESTVRSMLHRADSITAQPVTRRCIMCRVEFTQDRARTNFFRCELHRYADDWMAAGGNTGHKKNTARAAR